jgi:hypothetical protein
MSTEVDKILDSMSGEVPGVLIQAVKDAAEARSQVQSGELSDDPVTIHERLLYNRQQIERLEDLTSKFVLLKSRTAQSVAKAKGAYDDAYTAAATKPSIGFADFSSAKEKDAYFAAACVTEAIALRKAEALHRDVDSAWDYCRILLRGAEGAQRDLELRMRLISLTSSLER